MPVVSRRLRVSILTVIAVAVLAAGCVESRKAQRYSRKQAQESLRKLETPGLVLGEFSLPGNAVVDGDTVKVEGLKTSLRLLAIDTEETFKREKNRRASESDFKQYLADLRKEKQFPKTGTPMGEEAKK